MTMTVDTPPRLASLDHATAMRLAATEYARAADLLRSLSPDDWTKPTDCPGWDVRAMAGHMLGMAEMITSPEENARQIRTATERGGVLLDALTALQVEERAHMTRDEIVAAYETCGPLASAARAAVPDGVRTSPMPHPEHVNGAEELWTIGFLTDVILTRDPWMHRIDIARATGAELVHTPEHDGVLVDDVVHEWAGRHGQPCTLTLTGPAGGTWTFGSGGPSLEHDTVEFCRAISGRGPATGLLTTGVPF